MFPQLTMRVSLTGRTGVVFFDDGTAQFLFPLPIARVETKEIDPS